MPKTFRLLLAVLGIVAMIEPAQGAEKTRRRILQNPNDPYLAFVPGQPLLFAAERGRSVVYLRYPELVVERKLETPADRRLDVIKASPDGTWIAGFFEQGNLRAGGELRVWKLTTGETRLRLDDASRAYEFMDDHRLVVWQPKGGITQWDLGEPEARRFGPVITGVDLVQNNVSCHGMYLSPDARYLLICGTCRGGESNSKTDWWDYCLYDLSDGATVGWSEDPGAANIPAWPRDGEERMGDPKFSRQFSELLIGTNIGSAAHEGYGCRKAGENLELCFNGGYVSLIEVTPPTGIEPPPPPPPAAAAVAPAQTEAPAPRRGNKFSDIVRNYKEQVKAAEAATAAAREEREADRARRAAHEPTRRTLWTIPSGDLTGGRTINSCARSADGRWIAVAAGGTMVSLFDTEHLESNEDGKQAPTRVQQLELP
jgi:hypothetical protein